MTIISSILFLVGIVLFIITIFIFALSLVDLINFGADGGEFYNLCSEIVDKIKRARILGKILLIPVLIYCGIIETINGILALIILSIKACIEYMLNKNTTLKKAFQNNFGYAEHQFNDHTEYSFMGYRWSEY